MFCMSMFTCMIVYVKTAACPPPPCVHCKLLMMILPQLPYIDIVMPGSIARWARALRIELSYMLCRNVVTNCSRADVT